MKIKTTLQLLLISIIGMQSCSKSALSDIEITDPSLVRVSVHIAQGENNHREVQVFIYDKHNRPVELRNGLVEVNGLEANWDRAGINNFSKRGYIYHPDELEHDFHVSIYLNSDDVYWFDINPTTGFSGFIRDYPLTSEEKDPAYNPYIDGNFKIYDMPFRYGRVKVSYHILKNL
jgi:hypothetical protein